MGRYRRRTGKLSVAVHTTHRVGHTVRGGTGSHVVGVQGTARTTTRCHGEVFLTSLYALFLIRTGYGVLETRGVRRVTRDRYVYAFVPHDGYTFAYVVGAIAFYFGAFALGVGNFTNYFQFARIVVELSLYVGETIDTRDDLCGVFAQTIEDTAQGLFTYFVGFGGNFDGTFGSGKRLVTGQEGEAFGLFAEQTGSEVTVTETYFTVVGNRTGDTERLQTDTDGFGSVGAFLQPFFKAMAAPTT